MYVQKVIFELIVKYFLCVLWDILSWCWDSWHFAGKCRTLGASRQGTNMQCFLAVCCAL